jgi:phenylacetaldehyde dehydrogenase
MNLHPHLSAGTADFLSSDHLLLIDGKWVPSRSGRTFDVFDPGNGQVIAQASEAVAEDVELAVAAARKALEGPWSRISPAGRTRVLLRLADLIEENGELLAEIEVVDNGKPLSVARGGIAGTADMVRYMAGWATKLNGETVNVSVPGDWHAFTTRSPIGVVAQIIPWNMPLSMAIWKVAPALAVGCTVVLKPAEQTPLGAIKLGQLIQEAGIPDGAVNILTGFGSVAGAALAAHPRVDKVAFTGSTGTGKKIVEAALGNLKKVSLELGGKSPVSVFPDADLETATVGAANAIFLNSGQICSAGSRLFVHKKVFDRVVEGVARIGDNMKLGHGLSPETELGPLISRQQLDRVTQYVTDGRAQGARRAGNAPKPNIEGYFYPPTVLVDTRSEMQVVREEIFGPVVCAIPFDDKNIDQLAAAANDTDFGLFAGIWTRDVGFALKLAQRIKAGSVSVNAHMVNEPALPFGGFKQSGWGRERGREVLELYTELKSVAVKLG